jgi:hypothetical protein
MARNFHVPRPSEREQYYASLYFGYYGLDVLYRARRDVEAEQFMRTYWGYMLAHGAWTCWEFFVDDKSRCHPWSAAPTHYLSTRVLGVQFPEPGNRNKVVIAPQPGTLAWARGSYPHPAGAIKVWWEKRGDRLSIGYEAPPEVEVRLG